MSQNSLYYLGVGDIRDHPQRAAAQRANRNINIRNTLQSLRPGQWRDWRMLVNMGLLAAVFSIGAVGAAWFYSRYQLDKGRLTEIQKTLVVKAYVAV
jgi:hypothetical protein